jgi:hypothetical protein
VLPSDPSGRENADLPEVPVYPSRRAPSAPPTLTNPYDIGDDDTASPPLWRAGVVAGSSAASLITMTVLGAAPALADPPEDRLDDPVVSLVGLGPVSPSTWEAWTHPEEPAGIRFGPPMGEQFAPSGGHDPALVERALVRTPPPDLTTNDLTTADIATADIATADIATADIATADIATGHPDELIGPLPVEVAGTPADGTGPGQERAVEAHGAPPAEDRVKNDKWPSWFMPPYVRVGFRGYSAVSHDTAAAVSLIDAIWRYESGNEQRCLPDYPWRPIDPSEEKLYNWAVAGPPLHNKYQVFQPHTCGYVKR